MRIGVLAMVLTALTAACGDAGTDASGTRAEGPDPAAATTCAELADVAVDVGQILFDYGNRLTGDELAAAIDQVQQGTPPAALATYVALTDEVSERAGDLCGVGEFDGLFCKRLGRIVAIGDGSNNLLEALYDRCGGG